MSDWPRDQGKLPGGNDFKLKPDSKVEQIGTVGRRSILKITLRATKDCGSSGRNLPRLHAWLLLRKVTFRWCLSFWRLE